MDWNNRKKVVVEKIKKGKYKQLWYLVKRRLIINCVMKPTGIPIAIIVIPLIYILRPIVRVNLSVVPVGRIGHLSFEPEYYLRKKRLNNINSKTIDIFVTNKAVQTKKVSNKQLLKMFKRNLLIFDSYFSSWIYFSMEWILQHTDITFDLQHGEDVDSHAALINEPTTLYFTDSEIKQGNKQLKAMGINPDTDWFVLIFARDNRYLAKLFPDFDWGYHDWRNADINTYVEAVRYITDMGGYVLRIGSAVEDDLNFEHPLYIDYAKKYRNDFMDIFIISKCKFLLGNTSGICDVATVLDTPRVVINNVPLGYVMQGKNCIYIPKKILDKKTKTYISMRKVLEEGADSEFRGDKFLSGNCKYIDNTPNEIREVAEEMLSRLNGDYILKSSDQLLLEKYYSLFKSKNKSYGIDNPIGMKYLRDNSEWILA